MMWQEAVRLCSMDGAEFGRGLCNYSGPEVCKIKVRRALEDCFMSLDIKLPSEATTLEIANHV